MPEDDRQPEPRAPAARENRALMWAGALIGVATAGLVASLCSHLQWVRPVWPLPEGFQASSLIYEPLVATVSGLGVWLFSERRGWAGGLMGATAALVALLLADTFRVLGSLSLDASELAVALKDLPEGVEHLFASGGWPKILRCLFGAYIGWYLGSAGGPLSSPAKAPQEKG